jgi:hypothetical protein
MHKTNRMVLVRPSSPIDDEDGRRAFSDMQRTSIERTGAAKALFAGALERNEEREEQEERQEMAVHALTGSMMMMSLGSFPALCILCCLSMIIIIITIISFSTITTHTDTVYYPFLSPSKNPQCNRPSITPSNASPSTQCPCTRRLCSMSANTTTNTKPTANPNPNASPQFYSQSRPQSQSALAQLYIPTMPRLKNDATLLLR